MNAIPCAPTFFLQGLTSTATVPSAPEPDPLMQRDKIVEYIGDDPDTQRQVFHLCLDLLGTSLPRLRQAVDTGDVATLRRLAHITRGSLGMLGLPTLCELGEDVEYRYNDLGVERWRQRCEALYQLLARLQQELQVCVAA
jgi:HPt (histidine-containing phosphotransfer) domain-containing protein